MGCTWPPEIEKHGFSPEMDVSERDKKNLKSGASNFEKQKNCSILLKRSSQLRKQIIWWMSTWVPIWSRISKSRFFEKNTFLWQKIIKMLQLLCFSKLWAQIFRAILSVSNSFISGVFCVRTHLRSGYPPPVLTYNSKMWFHNLLNRFLFAQLFWICFRYIFTNLKKHWNP